MTECLQYEGLAHKQPDVMVVYPKQARLLQHGPARIVLLALREQDKVVTGLTECRTEQKFVELRSKAFSDYVNLGYIIANTFAINPNASLRRTVLRDAFGFLERFFRAQGVPALGTYAAREAVFCVSTLRRAYKLLDEILDRGPATRSVELDQELSNNFNAATLWALMHLDCLRVIMTHRAGLNKRVLAEIMRGLHDAVVAAYSCARHGLELRTTRDPLLPIIEADKEDQELLEESFRDYELNINAES